MSSKRRVEIECPKCAEKQSVIIWNSINVSLDEQSKIDFLKGRINLLECAKCGAQTPVQTNLLYHDMKTGFCAAYFPFALVADRNLAFDFNRHGEMGPDKPDDEIQNEPYDYMNHIHVTFDMAELIRYVVFRDRLVEDFEARKTTDKVKSKLEEIRDKARKGESDSSGGIHIIGPEDL